MRSTRQRTLEDRGARADIAAAVEVVLDELDSIAQRAPRGSALPEVSLALNDGSSLQGVIVEYAAWRQAATLRAASGAVSSVGLRDIASIAVELVGRELASGLMRVRR